jgi:hypothetical protein
VRIDGIKPTSSEPQETGKELHWHIAEYLLHLIRTSQLTDWQWAENKRVTSGDVAEIWNRFFTNFTLPAAMEQPGIENKLAFDRNWTPVGFNDRSARFRCVIDFHFRQSSLAVVKDWKTGRTMPESVEKDLQMRTYGWSVLKAVYPHVEEILLKLHFLRFGVELPALLIPADLATVPEELDEKIARIEADRKVEPTPGAFCGWCGVMAHCPLMATALVPVEILNPVSREDAVQAATLLLSMQVMATALKDGLKVYVQEHGPVAVGDMVYGPSSSTIYDLDPQEVTSLLLERGLSREAAWGVLSLSKDSLEKGLMRAGLVRKRKPEREALMQEILSKAPFKEEEKIGFKKIAATHKELEKQAA